MPVLRCVPGFRILEAALRTSDFQLPGGVTPRAYAEILAISEFGHSLSALLPAYPDQDASDEEFSSYYQRHDSTIFRCDLLSEADAIAFFDGLGWDLTDDQRRFSASRRIFGRLIEAMARGIVGCTPNSEIEAWRQAIRQIDAPQRLAANDSGLDPHYTETLED